MADRKSQNAFGMPFVRVLVHEDAEDVPLHGQQVSLARTISQGDVGRVQPAEPTLRGAPWGV